MAPIGETELDIRSLSRGLWRRAWLPVLLAILAAVATYLGLGYVEPLYTADTSILIEERESPLTRPRDAVEPRADFDEPAIQSQVEVIRSREIAEAVIDRLDLTRRPEFDPATRPSLVTSLLVMLKLKEHPADASIRQRVMDSYFNHLSVFPLARSRVIGVAFQAPAPELAAEVANSVADTFVELQQQALRESAVAATAWLEQEIDRLRSRVAEAEEAIAEFRRSNELFSGGQSGNLSQQQLSDLNAELARARAARAESESRAALIASLLAEGGSLEASEEVLSSQLIQRLRERQIALRAQIADLSTTLLPGHPRIRAMQGQLTNLEGQILQEAQRVLASLNTAARVAAAREESLLDSLNAAMAEVSRSNVQEIELRALEREATAQRDLLESFLGRYREAVARTDADYLPADARIISRAVAPRDPSYPKRIMMALVAAIAVFLITAAILLLREFTSGRAFRVISYGMTSPAAGPVDAPDMDFVSVVEVQSHTERRSRPRLPRVHEPARKFAPPPAPVPAFGSLAERELDEGVYAADDRGRGEARDTSPEPGAEPEFYAATRADEANEPNAGLPPVRSIERDPTGTARLAEIVASDAVRVALFAGVEGGEGAGGLAYATAHRAVREGKLRCVVVDLGARPSASLGARGEPGLGDLLAGEFSFGEVIRRDDSSRVHVIPMGTVAMKPPLQRLQLVIGALTHTYDKVIVVADSLADWPDEHLRPDLAAIVCGPQTAEVLRAEAYEAALQRGARSAIIVQSSDDGHSDELEASEAA
jgi:uncharacterized protein involved in exopolysaccharide biosynthesis